MKSDCSIVINGCRKCGLNAYVIASWWSSFYEDMQLLSEKWFNFSFQKAFVWQDLNVIRLNNDIVDTWFLLWKRRKALNFPGNLFFFCLASEVKFKCKQRAISLELSLVHESTFVECSSVLFRKTFPWSSSIR